MDKAAAYIAGVAMTPFGSHADRSVADLTSLAADQVLMDAGLQIEDIGSVFFGNTTQGALQGQTMIGGQIALRQAGFQGVPVVNVENACATGSTAFNLAVNDVRSGANDVALAIGVEKMNVEDRAKTMAVFNGAFDVAHPEQLEAFLRSLGGDVEGDDIGERSIFMDIYGAWARGHMERYGTTQEQIAAVASKNHVHAVHNSRAHYRKPMTVEQVLAGRPLAYPLTVPMCAPITDGAAAVIVCSEAATRRRGISRPVKVLASTIGTGVDRDPEDHTKHVTRLTSLRAYEEAGVGPGDISLAEVHDATAFAEIVLSELLGFCAAGEGGKLADAGDTTIGGRIPINPSGGLESKGHPLGATGLGQLFELVTQLRGEAGKRQVDGARIALAENGGGFLHGEEAVAAVAILGSTQ